MASKERGIIEILRKEDERFKLSRMGFFLSLEEEVDLIYKNIDCGSRQGCSFKEWKDRVLKEYYKLKDFSSFLKNNVDNVFLERSVTSLIKSLLSDSFSLSEKTDTDRYLAADNDTISFSLSPKMFESIYSDKFRSEMSIDSTCELDGVCKMIVKERFPLDEDLVVSELRSNENFYWNKVYLRIKSLSAGFSYYMSGIYSEDSVHEIWSDTCCTLNQAVLDDKLQHPTKAKDIVSYAVGIIKNKNRSFQRAKSKSAIDIDSVAFKVTNEVTDEMFFNNSFTIPENFPSQNEKISNYIDSADGDFVKNYMIVVLYNHEHPLHTRLVSGLEDKIKMLFEHYIDGLSYEELVVKHYGDVSEEEMKRIAARVRQEVKRVKTKLINKFNLILEEDE